MNWNAIGAVGELLGSFAVLATLIYLSLQIRDAREELKHTIRHNNDAANREIMLETVRNPRLTRALAKTLPGTEANPVSKALSEAYELEFEDAVVLTQYYAARLRIAQQTILYDLEFLDDAERRNFDKTIRRIFGAGAGNVFWQVVVNVEDWDPQVTQYMSKIIEGT